jgi:hypothetical protein
MKLLIEVDAEDVHVGAGHWSLVISHPKLDGKLTLTHNGKDLEGNVDRIKYSPSPNAIQDLVSSGRALAEALGELKAVAKK